MYDDETGGLTLVVNGGNFNVQSGGTSNVNSNTLEVFGTYNVQSGGIHNNNAAGFTKIFNGGNFNVLSGGTANDSGIHATLPGGTTTVSGQWNENGLRNTVFGTFNVASGGMYDDETGGLTLVANGGNFNVQSGGTSNVNSNTLEVYGTYNVQSGGIHNNNAAGFTSILNGGNFNVQSGGTVNDSGIHATQPGGITTVSGQWNEKNIRNTVFGTFNVASGGIYDNESAGLTLVANGGNFNLQTGGKVNNFGTYEVRSSGTATLDAEYDNNLNSITKNFGTMNLDCNGTFDVLEGTFIGTPIVNICPPP